MYCSMPMLIPNLSFLFRNQLQEADLVCFTKSDLYPDYPAIDAQHVRQISAKTGEGVAAWLDEILSGDLKAGKEILDIDYEQYARAEAALAWLNLQVCIEPSIPCSPAMVLGPLLDHLDKQFTANNISIVHLKAILDSPIGIPESGDVHQWPGTGSRRRTRCFASFEARSAAEPSGCGCRCTSAGNRKTGTSPVRW